MPNHPDRSTDDLDDSELLARETMQRDEFRRLERAEPQRRDSTYGLIRGSRDVIAAWDRWWKTNTAARTRGLVARTIER